MGIRKKLKKIIKSFSKKKETYDESLSKLRIRVVGAGTQGILLSEIVESAGAKVVAIHDRKIVKARKSEGLPAIQTGGNVGTTAWIISWNILKSKIVSLIGMDHGFDVNTSWEDIEKFHIGSYIVLKSEQGNPIPAVINNITARYVTVDANHHLAGKTLFFDIEVLEINTDQ